MLNSELYSDINFINWIKSCIVKGYDNFYFKCNNLSITKETRKMFLYTLRTLESLKITYDEDKIIFSGKIKKEILENISEKEKATVRKNNWIAAIQQSNDVDYTKIIDSEDEKIYSELSKVKEDKFNIAYQNIKYLLEISCEKEEKETCKIISINNSLELNKDDLDVLILSISSFDIITFLEQFDENNDNKVTGLRIVLGYSK